MRKLIILCAVVITTAYAAPKVSQRFAVPLSPWEAHRAVTLQRDVIADARERVSAGHGRLNDYIMLRFDMPRDQVTDEDLSEARRALLRTMRERMIH